MLRIIIATLLFCRAELLIFHLRASVNKVNNAAIILKSTASDVIVSEVQNMPKLKEELRSFILSGARDLSKSSELIRKVYEIESVAAEMKLDPTLLLGKWTLTFTNDDITRSSPFFWAFRKAFKNKEIKDPLGLLGTSSFAEGVFKITDSIPVKSIGTATQFIAEGKIISQVEVKTKNLPIEGRSLMTTTSSWTSLENQSALLWEVTVEQTEVKKSTIAEIFPILNELARPFPSGQVLDRISPGSSKVLMKHVYVDEDMRITKNVADDKYFVFERAADL